jgi:hypothetical protein
MDCGRKVLCLEHVKVGSAQSDREMRLIAILQLVFSFRDATVKTNDFSIYSQFVCRVHSQVRQQVVGRGHRTDDPLDRRETSYEGEQCR